MKTPAEVEIQERRAARAIIELEREQLRFQFERGLLTFDDVLDRITEVRKEAADEIEKVKEETKKKIEEFAMDANLDTHCDCGDDIYRELRSLRREVESLKPLLTHRKETPARKRK